MLFLPGTLLSLDQLQKTGTTRVCSALQSSGSAFFAMPALAVHGRCDGRVFHQEMGGFYQGKGGGRTSFSLRYHRLV